MSLVNADTTISPLAAKRLSIEWETRPLCELASMKSGDSITSADISDHFPFPCYGGNGLRGYAATYTHDGAFALIGRQGALCGNVLGVCGKLFASEHAIVVTPRPGIDIRWLTFVLQRMNLNRLSEASAQPGLSVTKLKDLPVATPQAQSEQQAIAAALSDADALIEGLESLIAKKRAIKQGAMQELLSGRRRLAGFSKGWQTKCLREALSIQHGKAQHEVAVVDGPYPILATGGQIGTANSFLCDKPSVLIGRKGTIDRPQYIETPFWTVDTLFYSVMKGGNSAKFFFYRFCLIDWYSHNEASGVPSLNARTIERIEVAVPEPDEQQAIAGVLSDMDEELDALNKRLSKARQIKQGMMQELLTGRVRLV